MPSVNVSQADFEAAATGAMLAQEQGDRDSAAALDKLARKINAALTNANFNGGIRFGAKAITWQQVPSVLNVPTLGEGER